MIDNMQDKRPNDNEGMSEERYRTMFEANPQPMWLYDSETLKILDVNKAAIKYYKYNKDKFLRLSINDIRPGQDCPTTEEAVARIKSHDAIIQNGSYFKSGKIKDNHIQIRNGKIFANGRKAELFFSSDINAVLAGQKEKIYTDEKVQEAQKIAKIGYWSRRITDDVSDWSDEMYRIFGRNPATFVPTYKNVINCFHPDDQHVLGETTFWDLSEKGVSDFEHRIVTEDGEIRWIFQRLQLKKNDIGETVEVTGVIQDITEKRKADEKFKAVFEHTRDAILIGDDAGHCQDVNDAAVSMLGYSKTELLKMSFHQLLNVPANNRYKTMWQRFLKGEILDGTLKMLRKNGSFILANFNAKPNILPGVHLCVITDITEALEKTRQLFESERRFTALVQESADIIAIIDSDGFYKFVGESSYTVLGIRPQEFLGKNTFEFIHPDDHAGLLQVLQELSEKKRIKTDPFRLINSDGDWRWITSIVTNLLDDPAVKGIVINARDITDSVARTEALKFSNERYKLIMKAANEAIYDWDIEKDKVEWGIGFQEVFGYDLTTYNNFLVSENISAEDQNRIKYELEKAVNNKDTEMMLSECGYHKANRDIVQVEYRIVFLRNEEGVAIRAIGSLRDINAYKQTLLRIQDQNEKLKDIAWQQSHMVRAPLTRLMALIDLIKNYDQSEAEKDELINLVLVSAHEFDQIIRDITNKTRQI